MENKYQPIILIVDDVSINLQVLGNILKKSGYKISAALSGKQALTIIENTKPDLILLDIMMPEMDGFEMCKILKSKPETKDIPIIFLTAKTEKQDVIDGINLGAVDYVTKPFNSTELLARVNNHIELKLSKDELQRVNKELTNSLAQIKLLKGLIPICANCKKIRDDTGFWQEVESYISHHTDANFSHGICPDCMKELYPDIYKTLQERDNKLE